MTHLKNAGIQTSGWSDAAPAESRPAKFRLNIREIISGGSAASWERWVMRAASATQVAVTQSVSSAIISNLLMFLRSCSSFWMRRGSSRLLLQKCNEKQPKISGKWGDNNHVSAEKCCKKQNMTLSVCVNSFTQVKALKGKLNDSW